MFGPDLGIIDEVIRQIKTDRNHYTCIALSATSGYKAIYVDQWKLYNKSVNNGKYPRWWDSSRPCKRARIKALKGFKQACINAAKKG